MRELVIFDPRLKDLEPTYSLGPTLRTLRLDVDPTLRVDLRRHADLQELGAHWSQVSDSISSASRLRVAYLRSYGASDLEPLRALTDLTKIVLKDRPKLRTLAGLSALDRIRVLEVYSAKSLVDIAELHDRPSLREVVLQSCRQLHDISPLRGNRPIRRLNVSECGDIASLSPLRRLEKLETLSAFGSTRILDNDLTPLVELPRLREVRMQSRRTYRPSLEEVRASLGIV